MQQKEICMFSIILDTEYILYPPFKLYKK